MSVELLRTIFLAAREHEITLVSAGLAFYAFNSLLALLVFFVIAMTTAGWVEDLLTAVEPVLWDDAETVLSMMEAIIGGGTGRGRAAILAGMILAWSSFTMFQAVNMAFGHVYGDGTKRISAGTIADTVLILVTVTLAVGMTLVVHISLSAFLGSFVALVASVPLLGIALLGTVIPMFTQFSPPDMTRRDVLPGAVLSAASWTVCAIGFRLYLTTSESVELYGVAGGVLLLLTVLYIGALALLVGVILNAVLAGKVDIAERQSPSNG